MKIANSTIFQGSYQDQSKSQSIESHQETLQRPNDGSDVLLGTQSNQSDYTARYYGKSQSQITQGDQVKNLSHKSELLTAQNVNQSEEVVLMDWRGATDNEQRANDPLANVWVHNQTTHVYEENQRLIFESVGEVQTEDGRTIDYMMQLDFQHHLRQESERETLMNTREWRDPLVISLTGQIPTIGNGSFEFDLNSDGQNEQLKQLGAGMGYIAFDKNGDGEINNGNELFGANSGRGFSELAQFDSDGNGWIDESDSIYHQLKVWQPNQNKLISFAEAEVGAIFLQADDTAYTFTKNNGDADARITQSSVALKENGQAVGVFQLEWADKQTFTINGVAIRADSFADVILTTSSQFDLEASNMGLSENSQLLRSATPFSINSTQFATATTQFSQADVTQYSESFIQSTQVIKNLNPPTVSTQQNRQPAASANDTTNDSNEKLSMDTLDENEDKVVLQLRAVIDALKDIRENNQKQQVSLEKKLISE
jgi:hypothetical protein